MAIGGIVLSRKRKPLDDPKKEVFNVCRPERAREVVQERFQSELVAARRLLQKAAAFPVPRSSVEPPAKRSKKASSTPVVAPRKMMAEEEEDVGVVGGVSPMAMAIAPPPLQLAQDEYVGIRGEYASPVAMPKNLGHDATISGSPSSSSSDSDSESGSDSDSDSDESADETEEEEDVDICGGVSPMVIVPAPVQLAEDEGKDICGDASTVKMPKSLCDDAIVSGSPSSSSGSDSVTQIQMTRQATAAAAAVVAAAVILTPILMKASTAQLRQSVPRATPPRTERIARAMELREARSRAREKARQEVLQTERAAMPDETVHWTVLKSLEIAQYNMAKPDNVLRELGLFLKADHDHQDQQHRHHQSLEEYLEEGEISS